MNRRAVIIMSVLFLAARTASAQDVRARLSSRGLPSELVEQVSAIAADATAHGLPSDPIADKAIEGYAKQVPADRIVAALRQYGSRMVDARSAVQQAGVTQPSGTLIAAATDAMGRGLAAGEIGRVVRAAPQPELATPGLTVAAALAAQGMPAPVAADVVARAIRGGSSATQILDLPSEVRAMESRGISPDDAGRQMLRGGPGGGGPGGGGPGDGQHGGGPGMPGADGHGGGEHDGRGGSGTPPPPRPGGGGRGPGDGGHGGTPRPPGGTGGSGGDRQPHP